MTSMENCTVSSVCCKSSENEEVLETKESSEASCDAEEVCIVCISDTHCRHDEMKHPVPEGDILIHSGDFTMQGHVDEVQQFNHFLGGLPHRVKLVIAGNHDVAMDAEYAGARGNPRMAPDRWRRDLARAGVTDTAELITNATYLRDSGVEVCGLRFWGSPWCPEYCNWAFMRPRGKLLAEKWKLIPDDIDVLITHTPPRGILDETLSGINCGCEDLRKAVECRVKPKLHVFGHIHESAGMKQLSGTTYVNASVCTIPHYRPWQPPRVVTLPVKRRRLPSLGQTGGGQNPALESWFTPQALTVSSSDSAGTGEGSNTCAGLRAVAAAAEYALPQLTRALRLT